MTSIISDNSEWETSPQNLILSQKSLTGVSSLIEVPIQTVGSRTIRLEDYPAGTDTASRPGCKQQRYTSWDCCSRSYVACITVGDAPEPSTRKHRSIEENPAPYPPPPDTPTEQELAQMTGADRRTLKSGTKAFYRLAGGLLTPAQLQQTKYRKLLTRSGARSSSSSVSELIESGTTLSKVLTGSDPAGDPESGLLDEAAGFSAPTLSPLHPNEKGAQTSEVFQSVGSQTASAATPPDCEPLDEKDRTRRAAQQNQPPPTQKKPSSPTPLKVVSTTTSNSTIPEPSPTAGTDIERALDKWVKDPALSVFGQNTVKFLAGSIKQVVKDGKITSVYTDPHKFVPTIPQTTSAPAHSSLLPGTKLLYSDTLPVFVVNVGSWRKGDSDNTPFSPYFNSILARLSNPQAEGALGAMIRAPSIRAGAAALTLAQGLRRNTNTVREEASLVRLGCIITSLDQSCYSTEIIYQRFVRGWEPKKYLGCTIYNTAPISDGKILAIPVDLFCSMIVGKMPGVTTSSIDKAGIFSMATMDFSWTCVPVSSTDLTSSYLVPYIQSFLTSEYWAGRVNHHYEGVAKSPDGKGKNKNVTYSIMPATSSVHIPGPKHVCLVLLDNTETDNPDYFKILGVKVPIFKGTEISPSNLGSWSEIWSAYYKTENAFSIAADSTLAFNEVSKHLAIGNTEATALAIIAHLYCRLYQGLGISTDGKRSYDPSETVIGGWSWFPDTKTSKDSPYKYDYFDVSGDDLSPCRRRIIGYNFSAISPFARAADSVILTVRENTTSGLSCVYWSGPKPMSTWGSTNVNTCDSIVRVSIRYGLVITTEYTLLYDTPAGLSGWIHMHSLALACQTCTMFSQNNIDLGLWLGFYMEMEDMKGPAIVGDLVKLMSQDYLRWFNLKSMYRTWSQWDYNVLSEYYGIDPFNPDGWFWSHFPLPAHLLIQWQKKVDAQDSNFPKALSYLWYQGKTILGINLPTDCKDSRMLSSHTIDFLRYSPIVIATNQEGCKTPIFAWVDQYSALSCNMTVTGVVPDYSEYLESSVLVCPMVYNTSAIMPPRELIVLDSNDALGVGALRETAVSALVFPDPFSLSDIISAAKNYLLYPLANAAMGYLTGGVPGAVIAGGSRLIGQAVSDLGIKHSTAKDVISKVADKSQEIAKHVDEEKVRARNEEREAQARAQLTSPTTGAMANVPLPPPVVPADPPPATVGSALDQVQ